MRQSSPRRPVKDERDEQIDVQAKSYSLEYVTAATQILTFMCLIKGNSAWKGSLSFVSLIWNCGLVVIECIGYPFLLLKEMLQKCVETYVE
nr:hypothetical protein [uncultured Agathobaculum sp.]